MAGMGTITIVNPDGLDATGFPGYRATTPTVRVYYEWGPLGTAQKLSIRSGDWTKAVADGPPFSTPLPKAGYASLAIPSGQAAGSFVIILNQDGLAQEWAYFSTGLKPALAFVNRKLGLKLSEEMHGSPVNP